MGEKIFFRNPQDIKKKVNLGGVPTIPGAGSSPKSYDPGSLTNPPSAGSTATPKEALDAIIAGRNSRRPPPMVVNRDASIIPGAIMPDMRATEFDVPDVNNGSPAGARQQANLYMMAQLGGVANTIRNDKVEKKQRDTEYHLRKAKAAMEASASLSSIPKEQRTPEQQAALAMANDIVSSYDPRSENYDKNGGKLVADAYDKFNPYAPDAATHPLTKVMSESSPTLIPGNSAAGQRRESQSDRIAAQIHVNSIVPGVPQLNPEWQQQAANVEAKLTPDANTQENNEIKMLEHIINNKEKRAEFEAGLKASGNIEAQKLWDKYKDRESQEKIAAGHDATDIQVARINNEGRTGGQAMGVRGTLAQIYADINSKEEAIKGLEKQYESAMVTATADTGKQNNDERKNAKTEAAQTRKIIEKMRTEIFAHHEKAREITEKFGSKVDLTGIGNPSPSSETTPNTETTTPTEQDIVIGGVRIRPAGKLPK